MKRMIRVALITSGGDCQGLNAAIRGVGKALYEKLDNVEIFGMYDGYRGLIESDYKFMTPKDFSGILTEGGTILGTSRQRYIPGKDIVDDEGNSLIPAMKDTYNRLNLDCLVIMGGNGTQKSAKLISDAGMNVVTLPKTIDNDIYGTDTTFGFQSAVDIATNVIDYIHSTASSHSRIVVVELMGRTEGYLERDQMIPGEVINMGDHLKVYVLEVQRGDDTTRRGPQVRVSRTHPNLVKRLFEMEVPEIAGGKVLIKGIAREAGSRTKMAVHSTEVLIDPVGACVGQRGDRVTRVVDELRGEKIDIIKWSENPAEFIANALNPANVREVYTEASGQRSCIVVVPDNQLSLAIGKEGQNARLAAKLTGWKIDIKSQSQYAEQMAAAVPQVEDEEQPAQELPEDFQPYEGVEAPETPADGDDTL